MILDTFKLDGKIAICTGTRRGLGRAMTTALAEAGADIVSFDRNDPEEARQAVYAAGRRFTWKKIDFATSTAEQLAALVDETAAEMGHIDILVNNAGICPREQILEYGQELWEQSLQVNLSAPWFLAQAAGRVMSRQGFGKIINIGSLLSHQGGLYVPGYAASKHGILGLTKSLSNELAAKGITVNAIIPGYIQTDFTEAIQQDTVRNAQIMDRIPMNRWGNPEDLMGVVVFLASDASGYITGADVQVDGGWLGR